MLLPFSSFGGMQMRNSRKCSFCGRETRDYFTAYFHRLKRRLTICHMCIKKFTPVNWNGLKDELEKIFLELKGG